MLIGVAVVATAGLAILVHAMSPAKADSALLDGLPVVLLGFPVVATLYFLVLFSQSAATVVINAGGIRLTPVRSGLAHGLSLALLYMIGMQEIMLKACPFQVWGGDFVLYQLLMGLGDAIPVVGLCVVVGLISGGGDHASGKTRLNAPVTILSYSLIVGTIRLLSSASGLIDSYIHEYPFQVVAWGYLLGAAFGVVRLLQEHAWSRGGLTMFFGVGLNWMIFNAFMGLVMKGAMPDSMMRGALDVAALAVPALLLRRKRGKEAFVTPVRPEATSGGRGGSSSR